MTELKAFFAIFAIACFAFAGYTLHAGENHAHLDTLTETRYPWAGIIVFTIMSVICYIAISLS